MKTNILRIKHLCALLLTALTFVACSGDNNELPTPPDSDSAAADSVHFTAIFGVKNQGTRALTDPGDGTLNASWQVGEQIAIVYEDYTDVKCIATVTAVDGAGNATVTATLPGSIENNQEVTFIYPASAADGSGLRSNLLATQDGTLATLSSQFDVATAEGNIVRDGDTGQPNGTVTLQNQFAICKFQFKDESDNLMSTIAKVTITDLSTSEVITVCTPTLQSAVYVAMKPSKNSTKFDVELSNHFLYTKTSNANLEAGLFYQPTLSASLSPSSPSCIPLTFEAKVASSSVTFDNQGESINLEYSTDGSTWTDCSSGVTVTLENIGDKVAFRGNNTSFSHNKKHIFTFTGQCYIYGNIMSLLESATFATATELKTSFVFWFLFHNQSALYNHPINELLLPATTLTSDCYEEMFSGCTNITKAPDLPATTLADLCYAWMFSGCTSLTKAPDLPATTLTSDCYENMFSGCTNITKAPDLPATTLADLCYAEMFRGCTNLNSIRCLATDISATNCTTNWLDGTAATGTFTKAASMTSWPTGASGIPDGWTVVDE